MTKTKKEAQTDAIKNALREPTPKDRVKFRVGRKSMDNKSAHMLAYVDARYVQDRLDDIVGTENWSNSYRMINDVLYCDITITFPNGEIVTKSDCGTESNVEKQKGQSSDAFKRSAVMLGIGRDLYDVGNNYSMWADLNDRGYPPNNWTPSGWGDMESPKRHVEPPQDSAKVPEEPQPPVQEPDPPIEKTMSTQEKADEVISRAIENAPDDQPKEKPMKQNPPLKEGTPPEDEWVLVKNLQNKRETAKAFLFLPADFKGDDTDFNVTGKYWVAKQFVKSSEKLMNGMENVIMARWMVNEKGFDYEEITAISNDSGTEPQVQAPENPVSDDDLPF